MTDAEIIEKLTAAIKKQILAAGGVPHLSIPSRKVLDELKSSTIGAMSLLDEIKKARPPAPVVEVEPVVDKRGYIVAQTAPLPEPPLDRHGYRPDDVVACANKVFAYMGLEYRHRNGWYTYQNGGAWQSSEFNKANAISGSKFEQMRGAGLRRPDEPGYKPFV
jgi:hypothetical protein